MNGGVFMENEVGFWDTWYGTALKWTLIGAAVLGTAGAALFFIKPFQEWVDDKFGNEYGKKGAFWFQSNIYDPTKSTLDGNEVSEQEIASKVKIGKNSFPKPTDEFLNYEVFKNPRKFSALSRLTAEIDEAEATLPSDKDILKSDGETVGMKKKELQGFRKKIEEYVSASQKWDMLGIANQEKANEIEIDGKTLNIPIIKIDKKINNKLIDTKLIQEDGRLPDNLENYALKGTSVDEWNNRPISQKVFELARTIDIELEKNKETLAKSQRKEPFTNYTGFEGGDSLHSWYDIGGKFDWTKDRSHIPFTPNIHNMWNIEKGMRESISDDFKRKDYKSASEKVEKAIEFFKERANPIDGTDEQLTLQYFKSLRDFVETAELKKSLAPILESTYGTAQQSLNFVSGDLKLYNDRISRLEEEQQIKDTNSRIKKVKEKEQSTPPAEEPKADNTPTVADKKVLGK